MPLVESFANPWAGVAGGLVGLACGFSATLAAAETSRAADMPSKFTALTPELHGYLVEHGARQDELLRRLAAETAELGGISIMQISPEQGALMNLLVRAIGARRALELGTFTGYSAICIARGLPDDGLLVTCDVSEEWTDIARRYFDEAGADRADRSSPRPGARHAARACPPSQPFDFAFIDADKVGTSTTTRRPCACCAPGAWR